MLKAPFPWFGGKSQVARVVWEFFGDVPNYVEPFAGSLAVLLSRDTAPRIETVNDKDRFLSNFWRAVASDPEAVAHYADWPVNECDLEARHRWLVNQADFRERMVSDPEYYDAKIAGWWVWGISQWIGDGWCDQNSGQGVHRKLSHLGDSGQGVHRKTPRLTGNGQGVHRKRPHLKGSRGVHRKQPQLGDGGLTRGKPVCTDYFIALARRLRKVRVCCGDWQRVLTPAVTLKNGLTGIFLDPPYSREADRAHELYSVEDLDVAHLTREWAIANGDNPGLRIALCGYEGEHAMPSDWTKIAWKAHGGYANQGNSQGRKNKHRERIWFSPHCLDLPLFRGFIDPLSEQEADEVFLQEDEIVEFDTPI